MKIGIDARFYGPGSKGLGRYTQKLITHLEDIDHKNEYVIFLRENNFKEYVPKNKNFSKVKADYRWYSFSEQIFFPFILYKQKCDLVHFPHFNVPILYFRKFVVTIHDLILLHYPTRKASTRSGLFYWMKYLVYRSVIASVVRRAKEIIAVSKFTAGDICDKYPHVCDKVSVIYEAAEIDMLSRNDDVKNLQKYDIIEPYMLYVGNAYPHKNLDVLVDVFAKYLHDGGAVESLILVGCDDYFYERLQTYITKKNLHNVKILHSVDDVLLMTLYGRASFFVFPSLYEGFGLPPLEAQLLNVPVLSSDHACMTEVLSDNGALYADATDIVEFAQAMNKIATDDKLREVLVTNGKKNASRYSWEKMAKEIYNIYKKNI
jgi:glycosyltransferase involved in cell wall biosynthesis